MQETPQTGTTFRRSPHLETMLKSTYRHLSIAIGTAAGRRAVQDFHYWWNFYYYKAVRPPFNYPAETIERLTDEIDRELKQLREERS